MKLMVALKTESEWHLQHLGVVSRKLGFICQSCQTPSIGKCFEVSEKVTRKLTF